MNSLIKWIKNKQNMNEQQRYGSVAKPKASDQVWKRIFHQWNVEAFVAHDYPDFYYMVTVKDKRPKYFWGETAWSDYQRYAVDELVTF